MNAVICKRRLVSGQLVEYWDNPDVTFGWTRQHLQRYLDGNDWVLLFNAVLMTAPLPGPETSS